MCNRPQNDRCPKKGAKSPPPPPPPQKQSTPEILHGVHRSIQEGYFVDFGFFWLGVNLSETKKVGGECTTAISGAFDANEGVQ